MKDIVGIVNSDSSSPIEAYNLAEDSGNTTPLEARRCIEALTSLWKQKVILEKVKEEEQKC